jgi:hypothetical protein
MKNILLQLSTLLLLLICFSHKAFAQDSNKTEIIYREGDQNKGIEKIVFKNAEGAQVGEFDVQANNPYDNHTYPVLSLNKNGSKRYQINSSNRNEVAQQFSINVDEIEESYYISSFSNTTYSGEYAIVAYNELIYSSDGDVHDKARRSTIKVIDGNGIIRYIRSISSDAQSLCITPNGKYYSYSFGNIMHLSKPTTYGFRLVSTENDEIIYEMLNVSVNVTFVQNGYIGIRGRMKKDAKLWLLDYSNGELYEFEDKYLLKEYSSLKSLDGATTITDLSPYRIR